jgi:DnaJ-domain-containing protein 1
MQKFSKLRRLGAINSFSIKVTTDNNRLIALDTESGRFSLENKKLSQPVFFGSSCNSQNPWSMGSQRSFFGKRKKENLKLYDILEVPEKASQTDIKKSFFKLAKMYHPDVNKDKNAQQIYVEINE